MSMQDSPEKGRLRAACYSLQAVSRVSNAKGMTELAAMQESANLLMGMAIIRESELTVVDDSSAHELTAAINARSFGRTRVGQAIQGTTSQIFLGGHSGHFVVVEHVADQDDWNALPVFLQNFLTKVQPPFHLVVAIEQAKLPGDDQHRHWAAPCLVVVKLQPNAQPDISFKFVEADKQRWPEERRTLVALGCMEPFLRLLLAGLVTQSLAPADTPAAATGAK